MKSLRILLYAVIMLLLAPGCKRPEQAALLLSGEVAEDTCTVVGDSVEVSDMTRMAWAKADSMLHEMTLEERVGQCFMPALYASDDSATLRKLRGYILDLHVGGVVLLKGNLRSAALMAGMGMLTRMPLFTAIDAEWGLGMRLEDAPDFPRNGRLTPQADEVLLFDYGSEVARECRRVGINMVLGPVIDVSENPRGVIGSRSFGGDPVRVADLGVAYARGVESGGVLSVAKHFPGHGNAKGDSHVTKPVIGRSLHQLDSVDLYPFRSYINAGLSGVMVGHLAVPAVDPENLPAAVSAAVIGDLLRDELGFRGLVLTDALNMRGAEGYGAWKALEAGADMVVAPVDTRKEIDGVVSRIKSGEMPADVIDRSCRQILFHKYLLGLDHRQPANLENLLRDVRTGADTILRRLR